MVCVHRCVNLFLHTVFQLDLLVYRRISCVWSNRYGNGPYRDVHVFFTGFGDVLLLHGERDDFGGHIAVGDEWDCAVPVTNRYRCKRWGCNHTQWISDVYIFKHWNNYIHVIKP